MNTVKITNKDVVTNKENDTSKEYEFQLLRDGEPANILGAKAVTIVVKNGNQIVLNRNLNGINYVDGLLWFRLSDDEYLGTGYMHAEFIVHHKDGSREIFPQQGYVGFKIEPRLKGEEVDLEPNNPLMDLEYLQTDIAEVKGLLEDEIGDIGAVLDAINGEVI